MSDPFPRIRSRRRLGRGQFRLATLLKFVAVSAAILGLWRYWYDQQAPYRALGALGANLEFEEHAKAVYAVQIDFSGTDVTDEQLQILGKVPLDIYLDLSGTGVSDEAIDCLIKTPRLRAVDLTGSKVSDAGKQRLVNRRPEVSVDWRRSMILW